MKAIPYKKRYHWSENDDDFTRSIAKHIERDASPLQLNKVYWAKRQDKVDITKAKKTIMFY